MRLHPVAPASVQPRRKHQPRPFHMVPAPAEAAGVGLALDRVQLVPAFEPHPAGFAQQQQVGGAVGAAGQGLDDEAVQMLPQPGLAELLGVGVQRILGKAVLGTRLAKERLARGIVTGQCPGVLEGFGLAHQPHAPAGLAQAGDADLAGRLQPGEQRPFLGWSDPQRHLAHKGGRALGWIVSGTGTRRHQGAPSSECRTEVLDPVYHRQPAEANRAAGDHSSPDLKSGAFWPIFCK